ncbi:MAG: hypothetical protein U5O15_03440 [Candidatus Krumholzibacteriota bacterium]|nr:hypothetical protein [Candidatus Krumholzibacteriota bacterium]
MSKLFYSFLLAVLIVFAGFGRSYGQFREDIRIVESPTAGIIPHGSYMYDGSVGPLNSLLFGCDVGFRDRLMIGVSFGLQNFIGRGEITSNDRPGIRIRLRLIEEIIGGPALAVGINTQGQERWLQNWERYERKSKGFYAVLSKSYYMLRYFSLHCGVNYSLENKYEEGPDLFAGLTLEAFSGLVLMVEYSGAYDDDNGDIPSCLTRGKGYLDTGVRIDYKENLRLKFLFKDLLDNYTANSGISRAVGISYVNYF